VYPVQYEVRVTAQWPEPPAGTDLLDSLGDGTGPDVELEGLTADQRAATAGDAVVVFNGTYYNLTRQRFDGSDITIAWNGTLLDTVATEDEPARMRFTITNTGSRPLYISTGEGCPFGPYSAQHRDGHSFLLWSPLYQELLNTTLATYNGDGIFSEVGVACGLGQGESESATYMIAPQLDGVRPGTYTVNETIDVAALEQPLGTAETSLHAEKSPTGTFRHTTTFTLTPG